MNPATSRRLWGALAGATAVGALLAVVDPVSCRLFPRCLLHAVTGLHCPGCGTMRALHELAHGHWLAAIRLNALTVLALPALGALWVSGRLDRLKPVWIWTLLVVVVAFGVLRNLPWYPWTLLAPQP